MNYQGIDMISVMSAARAERAIYIRSLFRNLFSSLFKTIKGKKPETKETSHMLKDAELRSMGLSREELQTVGRPTSFDRLAA